MLVLHLLSVLFILMSLPHSPSVPSNTAEEPQQATADVEQQHTTTTTEQKLLNWQNLRMVCYAAIVVCVIFVVISLIVLAVLGMHIIVECPKQTSELSQRLKSTSYNHSALVKELEQLRAKYKDPQAIEDCPKEKMDLRQRLSLITYNFSTLLNETEHLREKCQDLQESNEQCPEEKMDLSRRLNITIHNYTTLLNQTTRLRAENRDLRALEECPKEKMDLSQHLNISIHNYTTLLNQTAHLSASYRGVQEIADNCTRQLNETSHLKAKYKDLQALEECPKEKMDLSHRLNITVHNYTTLLNEMTHLRAENRDLKAIADNYTTLLNVTEHLRTKYLSLQAFLYSERLSFIWDYCDRQSLNCSRCLPGWTEHSSRCFFLSPAGDKEWEDARRECIRLGGDLAVVSDTKDQEFFTDHIFQNIGTNQSAWIGLTDMMREGTFVWVNGKTAGKTYWKPNEPNNAMVSWDKSQMGQDCVVIEPPKEPKGDGAEGWINSWDDIICTGHRHYLCENKPIIPNFTNTPPPP